MRLTTGILSIVQVACMTMCATSVCAESAPRFKIRTLPPAPAAEGVQSESALLADVRDTQKEAPATVVTNVAPVEVAEVVEPVVVTNAPVAAVVTPVATNVAPPVVETVAVPERPSAVKSLKTKASKPGRDSIITAERTDFDNKEGVIMFDKNVVVDDAQFILHSNRLFVFLDGTNDVKQIIAIGQVCITNEERVAICDKAIYSKKDAKIVMTSKPGNPARLLQTAGKGGEVKGSKITFWLDDERAVVDDSTVVLPAGSFDGGDVKKTFGR